MGIWAKLATAVDTSGDAQRLELPEEDLAKPQLLLWAKSSERDWYMNRRAKIYVLALPGLALLAAAAVLAQPGWQTDRQVWWAWILMAAGVSILGYCTFPYVAARLAFREHRKKVAIFAAQKAVDDLAGRPDLPLNELFGVNRKQLDAYQELTRRQQRATFAAALASSVVGLVVLVVGIVISLRVNPASDKYVVAGLTGLGTLLSAYITNTFFVMSRRSNKQLNLYYDEPRTAGQLILAERLMRSYDCDRSAEVDHMISEVLKRIAPPTAKAAAVGGAAAPNGSTAKPGEKAATG